MEQPCASYNSHLRSRLVPLLAHPDVTARLLPLSAELAALATLDLEPARPVLASCYSDREGGRPPPPPSLRETWPGTPRDGPSAPAGFPCGGTDSSLVEPGPRG